MVFLKSLLVAILTWLGFDTSPQDKADIMMDSFLKQCLEPLERGAPVNFEGFDILDPNSLAESDSKVITFAVSKRTHVSMEALETNGLFGCRVSYEFRAAGYEPIDFDRAKSAFEGWIEKQVADGAYREIRRCISGEGRYEVGVESTFPRNKPLRAVLYFNSKLNLLFAMAAEAPGNPDVSSC